MASWNTSVPEPVKLGDPDHVETHNGAVAAINEHRTKLGELVDARQNGELQGDQGPAGADGFPTETQWNDLLARVTALETAE